MKLVTLSEDGYVKRIYTDLKDPKIYIEKNMLIANDGNIKILLLDDYLLFDDSVEVEAGHKYDDSMRNYDQSHLYLEFSFEDGEEY